MKNKIALRNFEAEMAGDTGDTFELILSVTATSENATITAHRALSPGEVRELAAFLAEQVAYLTKMGF